MKKKTPKVGPVTTRVTIRTLQLERNRLEREANKLNNSVTNLAAELDACRRECGQLKNAELQHDLLISDLRLQIYHFQKLVFYTLQVTIWKENGDDS